MAMSHPVAETHMDPGRPQVHSCSALVWVEHSAVNETGVKLTAYMHPRLTSSFPVSVVLTKGFLEDIYKRTLGVC